MNRYTVSGEITIKVMIEVRAQSKVDAVAQANEECDALIPLYLSTREFGKPSEMRVDGGAWFDEGSLDKSEFFKQAVRVGQ